MTRFSLGRKLDTACSFLSMRSDLTSLQVGPSSARFSLKYAHEKQSGDAPETDKSAPLIALPCPTGAPLSASLLPLDHYICINHLEPILAT